jgi:CHAT domain-containing protein/Flp pilus assembly protein TadD
MADQSECHSCSIERNYKVIQELAMFLMLFLVYPTGLSASAATVEISSRTFGLIQQPIRQQPDAGSGNDDKDDKKKDNKKDVLLLEPGKSIRRELARGQQHRFRIELGINQLMKVAVLQDCVDVVVRLFGLDGAQIKEFDSVSKPQGVEAVSRIAEVAGGYQLVVQTAQEGAQSGYYEIRVEELRASTADEQALQEADNLYDKNVELEAAGKYDEALPLAERALDIRERILGPNHREVAAVVNSLGILYRKKGNYAKAEPLYRRSLAILEKVLRPDHPNVAVSLNNLGLLYYDISEYVKAEQLFQRSVAIWEKAMGSNHFNVAIPLNNLAMLYYGKGDYAQAESIHQRALAIFEKGLGPDHPNVAASLDNLANLYRDKGDYTRAESLRRRALTIRERALGPDHPDVALSLDNLATLYHTRGDDEKAEPLYQSALAIRERVLGLDHPSVAQSLNNLAVIYTDRGDYAKAESLHRHALAIREKALGAEHVETANSLNNLAAIYRGRRDYAKAEPPLHRALAILEKVLGPEHPDVAASLNSLGGIYCDRGEYTKAEPVYRRALAIFEKAFGPEHPYVAEALSNLAMLYAAKGEIAEAVTFLSRSNTVRERNLTTNLATGSERQKLAYLALFSSETDFTLSLHSQIAPHDQRALSLAFMTLLRRKGRGLDAMTDTIAALRRHAAPQDQALLDQLTEARSQLAALTLRESSAAMPYTYRARLRPFEERVEKLESELGARNVEFRSQTQPATLAVVQAALPAGSVLIEFAVYSPWRIRVDEKRPARYLAYLLGVKGEPQWVDLGEAAAIDRAVAEWRRALRNPNRVDVKRLARAVDELVMRPVRSLLGKMEGEGSHLLIAPDGSLNLIPFAALMDERMKYLIEGYTISYLTSGRDLVRLQSSAPSRSEPLVVANPTFGMSGEGQVGMRKMRFRMLPGTEREALSIKAELPGASVLLRERATEVALKQSKAPRLLHIATHGFFLDEHDVPVAEMRRSRGGNPWRWWPMRVGEGRIKIDNPLLRSGLVLAGVNERRGDEEDGVLTAMEAASLDLWGTRLVVLSACDTGIGEVRNGEGVYGLRRSLVLAGSETQVMSLWPVLDRETRSLMVGYYRRLLRGEGRGEGLRQIQLELLKDEKQSHPYYWASFIQVGEWANLDGRR